MTLSIFDLRLNQEFGVHGFERHFDTLSIPGNVSLLRFTGEIVA